MKLNFVGKRNPRLIRVAAIKDADDQRIKGGAFPLAKPLQPETQVNSSPSQLMKQFLQHPVSMVSTEHLHHAVAWHILINRKFPNPKPVASTGNAISSSCLSYSRVPRNRPYPWSTVFRTSQVRYFCGRMEANKCEGPHIVKVIYKFINYEYMNYEKLLKGKERHTAAIHRRIPLY
ncbi:Lethal(3)malignant brain tumor-like protein 4 [Manis javanica]|nr:Lethal(3)malignant brain tumor-like protein 4 [Manis javanica]